MVTLAIGLYRYTHNRSHMVTRTIGPYGYTYNYRLPTLPLLLISYRYIYTWSPTVTLTTDPLLSGPFDETGERDPDFLTACWHCLDNCTDRK